MEQDENNPASRPTETLGESLRKLRVLLINPNADLQALTPEQLNELDNYYTKLPTLLPDPEKEALKNELEQRKKDGFKDAVGHLHTVTENVRLYKELDDKEAIATRAVEKFEEMKKKAVAGKPGKSGDMAKVCPHCNWEHDPALTSWQSGEFGPFRVNTGIEPHRILKLLHEETKKSGKPTIEWSAHITSDPRDVFKHCMNAYRALVLTRAGMIRLKTPDEGRAEMKKHAEHPRRKVGRKPARKGAKRRPLTKGR